MKQRVTLLLEEVPYKLLRIMAAEENKSMSFIIEDFIMGVRHNESDPKKIKEETKDLVEDRSNEKVFKKDDPIFEDERDESTEKPVGELPPMCERQFCKQRSEGKYKVITNSGENEWTGNLCVWHWNNARKEGEVREA